MAFDHKQVFDAMACAHRHGVLQRMANLQGRALELAMEESGLNLADLLNKIDEISEEKLLKAEKILSKSGLLFKVAASDILMKVVARMIESERVSSFMVNIIKGIVLKAMEAENKCSAAQKFFSCGKGSCEGGGV